MTAVFAFAVYAVAVPLRLQLTGGLGGVALPTVGMVLGWAVSALAHLTVFTLVCLVLMVVSGLAALTPSPGRVHYPLLWAVSAAAIALTLLRVMLAPIAIRGPAAWLVAVSTGGRARVRLVGRRAASAGDPANSPSPGYAVKKPDPTYGARRVAGADRRGRSRLAR